MASQDGIDEAALALLTNVRIQLLPIELDTHYLFERDGFVALVERRKRGFGNVGAAGLLTATGLAPLVWRGEHAVFVGKGGSHDATQEQVEALRRFQTDLETILR